jgi:hypothetical protein
MGLYMAFLITVCKQSKVRVRPAIMGALLDKRKIKQAS